MPDVNADTSALKCFCLGLWCSRDSQVQMCVAICNWVGLPLVMAKSANKPTQMQ